MNCSKQLCILCEIQPKVIQDNNLNDIEVYPDFTSANNFIKLFNLKYPSKGGYECSLANTIIGYCDRYRTKEIENTKDFIKSLIEILEAETDDIECKNIKKAIKHKKWEHV